MGNNAKPQRKQDAMGRVSRVQEILRRWDPIGVRPGALAPADEYDSYAMHIVSMVAHGCSRGQLRDHLGTVRTDTIGVGANRKVDWTIAGEILEAIRDEVD